MAKKKKNGAIPKLAASSGMGKVDLAEVERLLEFMKKHRLELFEYENSGLRILLKKESAGSATSAPRAAAASAHETSAPAETTASVPSAAAEPAAKAASTVDDDVHVVKSPIVGTFYSAPSPGADSFVKIGARVDAGQILCIIEAMKLMNEIEADAAGEIVKVFVENGQPVEYGEKLFGIRTGRNK